MENEKRNCKMITSSIIQDLNTTYIDKQAMVADCVDTADLDCLLVHRTKAEYRLSAWFDKPSHIGQYAEIYAEMFATNMWNGTLADRASVIETQSVPGQVLVSIPFNR